MPARRPYSPSLTLAAASLGFVLVILDVTVVNVAMDRIQASLATDVTGLQWVLNAYTLVFASLLLTAGALGDRFGTRRVFVAGFVLFTLASACCGAAADIGQLIASRAAQGFGAALCVPSSLALLTAAFPEPAARSRAIGTWAGVGGLALAAGPVVGGLLVDRLGWPSIFFLNLPLGALGLWLTLAYAPQVEGTPGRGLDLPGQALAILSLAGLTVAFVEGGALGWAHPLVLGGFAASAAAGLGFLAVEARVREPMLPLSLFRRPTVGAASFVGLAVSFAYYGLMFVLSLYFQTAKGYSPLRTGLAFLPMTALVTVTNLVSGRLSARFGPRLPMLLGQALAAAGYLALAGIDHDTAYGLVVGPLLAAGTGTALCVPAMTAALLGAVEHRQAGIASGALNAARQIGGVIGVGVFGSLIAGSTGGIDGAVRRAMILSGIALILGCLAATRVRREGPPVPLATVEANMDGSA